MIAYSHPTYSIAACFRCVIVHMTLPFEALPLPVPMDELTLDLTWTKMKEMKGGKKAKPVLFVYHYIVTPSEQTFFLWLKIQIWARLQHQALQKLTVASGVLVMVKLSFRPNSKWIFLCRISDTHHY